MKSLLLSVLMLISIGSLAQVYNISDFTETTYPVNGQIESLRAHTDEIKVEIVNGGLQISKDVNNTAEYILPEGKLLPFNLGEWGGGLYYKPNDPAKKYVYVNGKMDSLREVPFNEFELRLIGSNSQIVKLFSGTVKVFPDYVKSFVKYNDTLYLAHGGISYLDAQGDKFTWKYLFNFPFDQVILAAVLNKDMLIATESCLYVVHLGQKEKVFEDMHFSSLYLNSIAAPITSMFIWVCAVVLPKLT